jgi:5-methylcytosine-specific restriction enzyme A
MGLFTLNQVYRRRNIHLQYGGSWQGGICPCKNFPFIFIFSGESGEQHGYKDAWENDKIFSYTGEGQINDMQFIRGNLALRDHISKGKRVFLFTTFAKGFVKFEGELELITIDYFLGKDKNQSERTAIRFFFKRVGAIVDYPSDQLTIPAYKNKNQILSDIPNETERRGIVTSRVGQGAYRKSILFRWDFKCAVTKYEKNEILIASHIVPWKSSSNEERLDVENGILLSPNYDALFDQNLISFEDSGKIILSQPLLSSNYKLLGISGYEKIRKLTAGNCYYLEKHRETLMKLV